MALITAAEASDTYGLTGQTLRRWAESGRINVHKPDRVHRFYDTDDLNREVPHVGRLLVRLQEIEASAPYSDALDRSND